MEGELFEYNFTIVSHYSYRLKRVGAERATAVFTTGARAKNYIGWLLLNRTCKVNVLDFKGKLIRVMTSQQEES